MGTHRYIGMGKVPGLLCLSEENERLRITKVEEIGKGNYSVITIEARNW